MGSARTLFLSSCNLDVVRCDYVFLVRKRSTLNTDVFILPWEYVTRLPEYSYSIHLAHSGQAILEEYSSVVISDFFKGFAIGNTSLLYLLGKK